MQKGWFFAGRGAGFPGALPVAPDRKTRCAAVRPLPIEVAAACDFNPQGGGGGGGHSAFFVAAPNCKSL